MNNCSLNEECLTIQKYVIMSKVKTDEELKIYLKDIGVDVCKILHSYRVGLEGICLNCGYFTLRCWLCDQCISCCNLNEKQNS